MGFSWRRHGVTALGGRAALGRICLGGETLAIPLLSLQVSAFSLFNRLIEHTAWSPDISAALSLGGRGALGRICLGSETLAVPLLSLAGGCYFHSSTV